MVIALGALLAVGCKDLAFYEPAPSLQGSWTGAIDSATVLTLVLTQDGLEEVGGTGLLSSESSSLALEVGTGVYIHPSVSLVFESDSGRFSLLGNRSPPVEKLLYGIEPVTITGQLDGPGMLGREVVLERQDSVPLGGP